MDDASATRTKLAAHGASEAGGLPAGPRRTSDARDARRSGARLEAVSGRRREAAGARARARRAGAVAPARVFLSYWPELLCAPAQ